MSTSRYSAARRLRRQRDSRHRGHGAGRGVPRARGRPTDSAAIRGRARRLPGPVGARTGAHSVRHRSVRPRRRRAHRVGTGPGEHRGVHPWGPLFRWPSDADDAQIPALVSSTALAGACDRCRDALDLFVDAVGSVAGNVAIYGVARAGVFVGGGIPPRACRAADGAFLEAFRNKPPWPACLPRCRAHRHQPAGGPARRGRARGGRGQEKVTLSIRATVVALSLLSVAACRSSEPPLRALPLRRRLARRSCS